jgi:hypothetical protein
MTKNLSEACNTQLFSIKHIEERLSSIERQAVHSNSNANQYLGILG